jgi:Spy/CpxP family protein refolding chaperone
MIMKQFAKSLAVATSLLSLFAGYLPAQAPGGGQGAPRAPRTAVPAVQSTRNSNADDDFAGLDYSDEQKLEIEKIRQDAKAHKDAVLKDTALSADQKDAMLTGFTRMEYGRIYKVLTPVQKKVVLHRVQTRRLEEQAAHQKQAASK